MSLQSGNEIKVRVGSEYERLSASRQGGNEQVRQWEFVGFGCELTPKSRCLSPIVPGWFDVMRQAKT